MEQTEFEQLVRRYERLVYTVCYQFTRNHHTAQDLAQDTFLAAYLHREGIPADNPKAWLARVAANKAKDHLKSAYSRRVHLACEAEGEPPALQTADPAPLPEEQAAGREGCLLVLREIEALPEPYHSVARLSLVGQLKADEIAARLGRAPKTVHTQLCRARARLRSGLEEAAGLEKTGGLGRAAG